MTMVTFLSIPLLYFVDPTLPEVLLVIIDLCVIRAFISYDDS